jgi:hypothetical protein
MKTYLAFSLSDPNRARILHEHANQMADLMEHTALDNILKEALSICETQAEVNYILFILGYRYGFRAHQGLEHQTRSLFPSPQNTTEAHR